MKYDTAQYSQAAWDQDVMQVSLVSSIQKSFKTLSVHVSNLLISLPNLNELIHAWNKFLPPI